MAKKTDSTIKPTAPTAPAKRAVKPAAKKKPAVKTAKAATAKSKPKAKATKSSPPAYTREDVALRAYFIAEKRHAHGLPGSEHQDWLEAERQLAAESSKSKKAKKV